MRPRHIVFIGAMGSGKSTIGRRVAAALHRDFVDNDEMLERRTGVSAAALEARAGIDEVHRVEAETLLDALAEPKPAVIAGAASTIERPAVRDALRDGPWVVWVRADPEVLTARLPSSTRPFADRDPAALVAEQSRDRDAWFAAAADATLDTGREPVDATVARALAAIDRAGVGTAPG